MVSCIRAKQDFAFETTLAGRTHLQLIKRLRADGWWVELIYLALPSVEMSKWRVLERVRHGGHDIPLEAVERHFARSLRNLFGDYGPAVNEATCFMNTGASPELAFRQQGVRRDIYNPQIFDHLLREAKP